MTFSKVQGSGWYSHLKQIAHSEWTVHYCRQWEGWIGAIGGDHYSLIVHGQLKGF